ncbi:unnamed protein product [Diamesa serratosioi]
MTSSTPPSKNLSPLRVLEHRSQDSQEPPTDLSTFNMKSANIESKGTPNDTNNNSNKNNPQQFCLRWNNYQTNLTCVFDQLLQSESFVDVTLACDGNQIKAHKIVLSACSPYFQSLFFENPCQHPIIIMRDVKWLELKAIVEFMYKGEINVNQEQISPLLAIAEMLQIRGLAEVNGGESEIDSLPSESQIKPKQNPSVAINTKPVHSSAIPAFDIEEHFSDHSQQKHLQYQKNEKHHQQQQSESKKARIIPRDWESMAAVDAMTPPLTKNQRKRRWPSIDRSSLGNNPNASPDSLETSSPLSVHQLSSHPSTTPNQLPQFPLTGSLDSLGLQQLSQSMHHPDDLEIKPGIAEMIREEERAKLLENSAWLGASQSNIAAESYQYQLQSMWQKCWNSQNLVQHMRFRERGPLKSWRPETMAEAIFSVLKEGLSLSQAARKYDIPYPTFVLYANRVHNMLGPSMDGGTDLRPKGRGRPQRILLGVWPDEHIKAVIKSVVFRDEKNLKEEQMLYGRQSVPFPFQDSPLGYPIPNGMNTQSVPDGMSQDAVTAAAVAAVRQQMCNMVDAANFVAGFNLPPNMTIHPAIGASNNILTSPKNVSLPLHGHNDVNKNTSSIGLQYSKSGSGSSIHSSPNDMSLHGIQSLSPKNYDEIDFNKSENNRLRKERFREGRFEQMKEQHTLNFNHKNISPTLEAIESGVNYDSSEQTLDMSFKTSRQSSIIGEEGSPKAFLSLNSPIKLEPISDCRE